MTYKAANREEKPGAPDICAALQRLSPVRTPLFRRYRLGQNNPMPVFEDPGHSRRNLSDIVLISFLQHFYRGPAQISRIRVDMHDGHFLTPFLRQSPFLAGRRRTFHAFRRTTPRAADLYTVCPAARFRIRTPARSVLFSVQIHFIERMFCFQVVFSGSFRSSICSADFPRLAANS